MFEVGKRYRAIKDHELLRKNNYYLLVETEIQNNLQIVGEWQDAINNNSVGSYFLSRFDPAPIDDTPAPRMVTTCDIGARVVRVKIDKGWSSDFNCPVGRILTIKEIDNDFFRSVETNLFYSLSDFVLADEQPEKDPAQEYGEKMLGGKETVTVTLGKIVSDDDVNDKTPPDPLPGIASVMFGSKPRLMYGSLMQIQGPTKDEQERAKNTEEERKRYEQTRR